MTKYILDTSEDSIEDAIDSLCVQHLKNILLENNNFNNPKDIEDFNELKVNILAVLNYMTLHDQYLEIVEESNKVII